ADELPLLEPDAHQLSVDAGLDGDGIEWGDRAEPGEIDAYVARPCWHCHYGYNACGGAWPWRGGTCWRLPHPDQEGVRPNGQQTNRQQSNPPVSAPRRATPLLRHVVRVGFLHE